MENKILAFEFLENNEYLLQFEETLECKKLNHNAYRNQVKTWLMPRKENQ